jgi:hypothetical protein
VEQSRTQPKHESGGLMFDYSNLEDYEDRLDFAEIGDEAHFAGSPASAAFPR